MDLVQFVFALLQLYTVTIYNNDIRHYAVEDAFHFESCSCQKFFLILFQGVFFVTVTSGFLIRALHLDFCNAALYNIYC